MSSAETKPAADGGIVAAEHDPANTEVDVMRGFIQTSLLLRSTNLQTHATYGDEMQLLHDSMEHARRIGNGRVRFAANDPKVKATLETLVRWLVTMQGMCEIAALRSQGHLDAHDSLRVLVRSARGDIAKAKADRDGALTEVAALQQRVHSLDEQLMLLRRQYSDEVACWREEAFRIREEATRMRPYDSRDSYRIRG